ncbi:MAG: DUF411 domain-containing protein [Gemmatimonadales bacterium]
MLTRRELLTRAGLGALGLVIVPKMLEGLAVLPAAVEAKPVAMKIYKSASCGCCKLWVAHVNANGFAAQAIDLSDADLQGKKQELGVPEAVQSCHTAVAGNYVIEGHVPADLILRLLKEHPVALGLAVPGMVAGSPGMEGRASQHYDVVMFQKNGATKTYATR